MELSKEQVATIMTFTWREGQTWGFQDCKKGNEPRNEIHPGSLRYLREKLGKDLSALDLENQKIAKQILQVL
jgi:hypothetical protein